MVKKKPPKELNLSGVKLKPETKAAMLSQFREEAAAQESFAAWVRRKLLTPMKNGARP